MTVTDQSRTPVVKLNLKRQAATCTLFMALAAVIMTIRGSGEGWSALRTGWAIEAQAAIVLTCVIAGAAAVRVAAATPKLLHRLPVPQGMQHLDLSGHRPLVVALMAGVGEELLFRAALQPLLGLGGSALVFAMAHARTALLASGQRQRWLYLGHTLMCSMALGLIYEHLGLLVAMGLHVLLDWVVLTLMGAQLRTRPADGSQLFASCSHDKRARRQWH